MNDMDTEWTIREMASLHCLSMRTLRFYEEKGLLRPRTVGQRRFYGAKDHVKVELILKGKRLGFSLLEIKALFDLHRGANGAGSELQLDRAQIVDKIADLTSRRAEIDRTISELQGVLESGIL